jgi:hypothetical protein
VLGLFQKATADPHHRVAANAAVGLHRAGDLRAVKIVERMAKATNQSVRAAAVWAMGETRDPRFLRSLQHIVGLRAAGPVQQNAIRATVRIRKWISELRRLSPLQISADWSDGRLLVTVQSPAGACLTTLPPTAFVVAGPGYPVDLAPQRPAAPAGPALQPCYEIAMPGTSPEVQIGVYAPLGMGVWANDPSGSEPAAVPDSAVD